MKKKNNKIRICIGPYELNTAMKREHYVLPILDDILHKFKESRIFSKVDLKNGYWQIELDKESSKLTTFQANDQLYRWTRLPFGLKTSSEIFQKKKTQWHSIRPKRNLLYSWRHHKTWKKSKGTRQKPIGIERERYMTEQGKIRNQQRSHSIHGILHHQRRSEDRRREDHHNRAHERTN